MPRLPETIAGRIVHRKVLVNAVHRPLLLRTLTFCLAVWYRRICRTVVRLARQNLEDVSNIEPLLAWIARLRDFAPTKNASNYLSEVSDVQSNTFAFYKPGQFIHAWRIV